MLKKKELKKLAILFPIVILAGCIQFGSSTGNGPGLKVVSFAPSDNNIQPNIPIILNLIVENDGGDVARNIHVTLGGLTDDWAVAEGNYRTIPDIEHVDANNGVPNPIQQPLTWTITGPALANQLTYQPTATISYDYSTTLDTLIRATTSDNYRLNKPQTGLVGPTSVSNGPISITVTTQTPVFAGYSIPVNFQFNNIGSGRVVGPAIDTLYPQVSGDGISCPANPVPLISTGAGQPGKSGFLRCTMFTSGVATQKDFRITISVSYKYSITAISSVTVLPRVS